MPHQYKIKDLVLVKNKQSTKFGKNAYNGPWTIQEVRDNGTVKITKGLVSDVYNICNITPYINQSWIMGKCAIKDAKTNWKLAKLAQFINEA